jgi:hypothetical protein
MKKTTWVIIGLSVCVVILATALVVVLTQRQAEAIMEIEPLLQNRSFSISRTAYTKSAYYAPYYADFKYPASFQETGKKVDFLGEKIPGYPGKVMFLKRPDRK